MSDPREPREVPGVGVEELIRLTEGAEVSEEDLGRLKESWLRGQAALRREILWCLPVVVVAALILAALVSRSPKHLLAFRYQNEVAKVLEAGDADPDGNRDWSLRLARKWAALDPGSIIPHYAVGLALAGLDRLPEARRTMQTCVNGP